MAAGGAKLLLENRINQCEKASMISSGNTRSMSDDQLQLAISVVVQANVDFPLPIRLDLAERHLNRLLKNVVSSPAAQRQDAAKSFVDSLLPYESCAVAKDDITKPTYANICKTLLSTQAAALQECELAEEVALQAEHDEQWEARSETEKFCVSADVRCPCGCLCWGLLGLTDGFQFIRNTFYDIVT